MGRLSFETKLTQFDASFPYYLDVCTFRSQQLRFQRIKNVIKRQPPNYSILIFTHFKLCLADAIHNFKWVKIIQIWQNGAQLFSNPILIDITCYPKHF